MSVKAFKVLVKNRSVRGCVCMHIASAGQSFLLSLLRVSAPGAGSVLP